MIHCELCCYSSSTGAPYSVQQEQADRVKEEQIERQSNAIITTEDVDQPVSNYNLIMHKYDNNSNGVDIQKDLTCHQPHKRLGVVCYNAMHVYNIL